MILYNILHYHHMHRGIRLTELKALNQYFAMAADFMKLQFINRFLLTCQCFITVTICRLAGISEKILRFWWRFSKRPLKTQANFYISYKRNISTTYMHKLSFIRLRPHEEKSFWNYTLKLALQRLLSNLHQRMCFHSDSYHLQQKNRQI